MNKTKYANQNRGGFTLVELLVSIGIIATLTAILLPNFMGARERARDAQKIQDAGALKNALRMYYNDRQAYPTPAAVGSTLGVGMSAYTTATGIGYTYFQRSTGPGTYDTDSFVICIPLENGQGDEDENSQVKCGANLTGLCGYAVGVTGPKVYAVCAN